MIITWLGHSCFLLETSQGSKILIDPFDSILGSSPYKGSVNIITISHNHFDHNFTKEINPGFLSLTAPGSYEAYDIKIQGFPSYHDNVNGFKRGSNTIFTYEADNLRICHLGDLGHMLTDDAIDLLGSIDVLFIPISSNFTLDAEVAYSLCRKIQSKLVIPMHYKTAQLNFPGEGIEKFIALMKNAMNLDSNTLVLDELPPIKNQVKLLKL